LGINDLVRITGTVGLQQPAGRDLPELLTIF
jgi:hypothetical protein